MRKIGLLSVLIVLTSGTMGRAQEALDNNLERSIRQLVFVGEVIETELVDSIALYMPIHDAVDVRTPIGLQYYFKTKAKVLTVIEGEYKDDTISFTYCRPMVNSPEYNHYKHFICRLQSLDGKPWNLLASALCFDIYKAKNNEWVVAAFSGSRYNYDAIKKYGKKVELEIDEYISHEFVSDIYSLHLKLPFVKKYANVSTVPPIQEYYAVKDGRAVPIVGVNIRDFMEFFPTILRDYEFTRGSTFIDQFVRQ